MFENTKQATENFWMAIYLRFLAIVMAYGALVHMMNLLGFGEVIEGGRPLTWTVEDLVYGLLDTATAIGLWQKTIWGILCFFSAIASQFIIYTVFIDYFAFTIEQKQTIYGLLGTEVILLLVFGLLFVLKK
ncbi:hypothetical protein Xen7305DRAFT_00035680 [Xenococcus sp. PCC 7305]|uniref:hypothetical protein n=1 Tax=Xenococcus sp. PCC 7305 TaxID=102125 RepID=UPI0002AD0FBF|nr:hypothetical protein [Xenococcus sp. PCC 7305]ELS03844.1 hypothetical protein Xen7305DRAFT_00035680 [Xenococcus sp. PCC 7305]